MFRGFLVLSVMPRRLKIPASETVKWHHSDITMAQRFQSTHNGKAPVHSDPNAKRKPRLLDEDHIEALRDRIGSDTALAYVPYLAHDVHDFATLHEVGEVLFDTVSAR